MREIEVLAVAAGAAGARPQREDRDAWLVLLPPRTAPDLVAKARAWRDALELDAPPPPAAERLARLRQELARRGVDGFVMPTADSYMADYSNRPLREQRMAWLTGFTGNVATLVLLGEAALLFVDARYRIRQPGTLDLSVFGLRIVQDQSVEDWLTANLRPGQSLGYDPRLHLADDRSALADTCARAGAGMVALAANPVDAIWSEQPAAPMWPVTPHPIAYAGQLAGEKIAMVAAQLLGGKVDVAVLADPTSTMWLLNLRGGDVGSTPMALCRSLLWAGGSVDLFIDRRKMTASATDSLPSSVRLRDEAEFTDALTDLSGRRVLLDPTQASAWIFDLVAGSGAAILRRADPCAIPRACKNPVEIAGSRAAHHRDGLAVVRWLHWLTETGAEGNISEWDVLEKLRACRRALPLHQGPSFEAIGAAGANGAALHYRPRRDDARLLAPGDLFLCDSGGQFLDGTTDITRVVAIGDPPREAMRDYTLVLRSHIAFSTCRFPAGTTGQQLDTIARQPLWAEGMDYWTGTSHGVGSYLSVHEMPPRVSKIASQVALAPGMILSVEPGFYRPGKWGIRIENLLLVVPDGEGADGTPFLCFETLTRAPYEPRLIDTSLLNSAERAWVSQYHAGVRDDLSPFLDAETAAWLAWATAPAESD